MPAASSSGHGQGRSEDGTGAVPELTPWSINDDIFTAAGDGMTSTLFLVAVVIVTALFFDFTNGFHDSANAMGTSVATAAFKPRTAVLVAAVLNVVGAFLSTEVAKTISGGIVNDALVTPTMIFAGLVAAILWN